MDMKRTDGNGQRKRRSKKEKEKKRVIQEIK